VSDAPRLPATGGRPSPTRNRPGRRSGTRLAAAAVLLAVVSPGLAGCSMISTLTGSTTTTTTTTTTKGSSAAGATASPVPSATPRPPTTPAPPLSTGNSWAVVVPQLLTYGQWVLANPDPSLVPNVAAPGCSFDSVLSLQTQSLLNRAAFLQPSQLSVLSIQAPGTPVGAETTIAIEASRRSEQYVDASGTSSTGTLVAALPPTYFDVTLDLGSDKQWRICSITEPEVPGYQIDLTRPGLPHGEQGLALL